MVDEVAKWNWGSKPSSQKITCFIEEKERNSSDVDVVELLKAKRSQRVRFPST